DKDNGDVLNEIGVGSAVVIQATVGHDGNGESKIFTVLGATRLAGAANYGLKGQTSVPGTMAAFGLSAKAAAQAVTTTVTSTSRTTQTLTSTTTSVSTSTKTSVSTSVTTSVSTSVAPAKTQTATVTSEVTEEVGMSSTVTYAAIAVAVIAIIGAAVLYTRKQ
ncbi:MAG: hypothetical protein QGF64_07410, partial [Candidatus Poseidoniia archaeon]|nr:hypothetical protein [Candidatus Poseidoniia archaeon]